LKQEDQEAIGGVAFPVDDDPSPALVVHVTRDTFGSDTAATLAPDQGLPAFVVAQEFIHSLDGGQGARRLGHGEENTEMALVDYLRDGEFQCPVSVVSVNFGNGPT
jgi:hypothetical protein